MIFVVRTSSTEEFLRPILDALSTAADGIVEWEYRQCWIQSELAQSIGDSH